MSDQRIHVSIRGTGPETTGYIRASTWPEPGPGNEPVNGTEVSAYWFTPMAEEDGPPYLVVEVDGDSPIKIVRHDHTLLEEGL